MFFCYFLISLVNFVVSFHEYGDDEDDCIWSDRDLINHGCPNDYDYDGGDDLIIHYDHDHGGDGDGDGDDRDHDHDHDHDHDDGDGDGDLS
jgi:hypothetical protein